MVPESRDEVQQRIASLYDQAENATGNYNATRAMAAVTRSRGVPLAKRSGRRPDPALDEMARQWFEAARAKLGPTVPAVLPADRLPGRPRDRMRGGAVPGGERNALESGLSAGRPPALERAADRAVAELPAGDWATPSSARPRPALESGRAAPPSGPPSPELPRAVPDLAGASEPWPVGTPQTPEPTWPGAFAAQQAGALMRPGALEAGASTAPGASWAPGAEASTAPGWEGGPSLTALAPQGEAPSTAPEAQWATALMTPGSQGASEPVVPGPQGAVALMTPGSQDARFGQGPVETAVLPVTAPTAAASTPIREPRPLPGSAVPDRPSPGSSKANNRRKLAVARDLLSQRSALPVAPAEPVQPVSGTAAQPASVLSPAQDAWRAEAGQAGAIQPGPAQTAQAEQAFATRAGTGQPAAVPMGQAGADQGTQASGQWQQPQWAAPGGVATAQAEDMRPDFTAPATATGTYPYPAVPALVTGTGSLSYSDGTSLSETGSFQPLVAPAVGADRLPPLSATEATSPAPPSGTGPVGAALTSQSPPSPATLESSRAMRAAEAIAFARAQIGKPCVWGATGPDSYDCSSLTQAAWRAAGVTVPRAAHEQALAGAPVTLAGAEPGDLVLFFGDDRHVGLHVGGGMMVHAPGPGSTIREESIYGAGESAIHRIVRPA